MMKSKSRSVRTSYGFLSPDARSARMVTFTPAGRTSWSRSRVVSSWSFRRFLSLVLSTVIHTSGRARPWAVTRDRAIVEWPSASKSVQSGETMACHGREIDRCLAGAPRDAERLVLLNTSRERSLGFFVRRAVGDGTFVFDDATLRRVVSALTEVAERGFPTIWSRADLDVNDECCVCILHHRDTTKRAGVTRLLDELGLRRRVMIGNGLSDYIDDGRVVHGAVGNARAELKALASRVAGTAVTEGALELLEHFTQQKWPR